MCETVEDGQEPQWIISLYFLLWRKTKKHGKVNDNILRAVCITVKDALNCMKLEIATIHFTELWSLCIHPKGCHSVLWDFCAQLVFLDNLSIKSMPAQCNPSVPFPLIAHSLAFPPPNWQTCNPCLCDVGGTRSSWRKPIWSQRECANPTRTAPEVRSALCLWSCEAASPPAASLGCLYSSYHSVHAQRRYIFLHAVQETIVLHKLLLVTCCLDVDNSRTPLPLSSCKTSVHFLKERQLTSALAKLL